MNSETLETPPISEDIDEQTFVAPKLEVSHLLNFLGKESTAKEMAAVLYIETETVESWLENPSIAINAFDADIFANRVGCHPFKIWEWAWVDSTEDEDV